MAIFYSSAAPRAMDEPALKRPRTTGPAVHFKAMQLSWTSLALVGIDNHGKVSEALVQAPPQGSAWGPSTKCLQAQPAGKFHPPNKLRLLCPSSSAFLATLPGSSHPVIQDPPTFQSPPTPALPVPPSWQLPWLLPSLPKNIPSQGARSQILRASLGGI